MSKSNPTFWQKWLDIKKHDMFSSNFRSLKSFSHVTFTMRPTTPHKAFTTMECEFGFCIKYNKIRSPTHDSQQGPKRY